MSLDEPPGKGYTLPMRYYPLFLSLADVRCLVVGAGPVGRRKIADLLSCRPASLLVVDPDPDEAALESPFFGANVQSMLKLGRAQGVAMAAALSRGLPVSEYAPRRVKQAITGRGSASKEQVASLLKSMLHMTELPSHLDATDGLAVAVCHHFQCSVIGRIDPSPRKKALGGGRTGSKSWAEFISSHPDRIKGK